MVAFSLDLHELALERTKKLAKDYAIECYGEEDVGDNLNYNDLRLDIDEMYFDETEERLVLNGSLYCGKEELGSISSYDLPMDLDLVVKLVQVYMKKLGKLKTVLEATK